MKMKTEYISFFAGMVAVSFLMMIFSKNKKPEDSTGTGNRLTSKGAINNPGNIRTSGEKFQGEIVSPSDTFKSFSTLAYGYRAMIKILQTYYRSGSTSIEQMIYRWAPPSDNNPSQSYVKFVADGIGADSKADAGHIVNSGLVSQMVFKMSQFEQGKNFTASIQSAQAAYDLV